MVKVMSAGFLDKDEIKGYHDWKEVVK